MRWICDDCQAVHHYLPKVCQRCGGSGLSASSLRESYKAALRDAKKSKKTDFEDLMEELEDGKE